MEEIRLTLRWSSFRFFHSWPISFDKSVNEKSKQLAWRVALTGVVLLEHGPAEVVEEHVGGQWALKVISVSILQGFLVFFLLDLFGLFALGRRLAPFSLLLAIWFALDGGGSAIFFLDGLGLMLGAGWLAGLVVVYGRGIKVRKIILNLLWLRSVFGSRSRENKSCQRGGRDQRLLRLRLASIKLLTVGLLEVVLELGEGALQDLASLGKLNRKAEWEVWAAAVPARFWAGGPSGGGGRCRQAPADYLPL
jgi:hypothetical protein